MYLRFIQNETQIMMYGNICFHLIKSWWYNFFRNFIIMSPGVTCRLHLTNPSERVVIERDVFKSLTHWGRVTYMHQYNIPTLLQIAACRLFGAKPLSEPMLPYCQLDHKEHISVKSFFFKFRGFHSRKCTLKWRLWNGGNFVSASMHWMWCCVSQDVK